MDQASDVIEVCNLLGDQKELLWRLHLAATDPPGRVMDKADLANFLLFHGLHIHEMAKAALVLMQSREPYGVVMLGRSALESAFMLSAAKNDLKFGPQRMAYELEEQARKLRLLADKNMWPVSRRPTPEDCLREAERIRRYYDAPSPAQRGERDRIEKIERIAQVANLEPFYDDEYRLLSLTVHGNQAGILNAGSGFLVRKGLLAVCNAAFIAGVTLCDPFHLRAQFDCELKDHQERLGQLMQHPDYLPKGPDIFGSATGADNHNSPNSTA